MSSVLISSVSVISSEQARLIKLEMLAIFKKWLKDQFPKEKCSEELDVKFLPSINPEESASISVQFSILHPGAKAGIWWDESNTSEDVCWAIKGILGAVTVKCVVTVKDEPDVSPVG